MSFQEIMSKDPDVSHHLPQLAFSTFSTLSESSTSLSHENYRSFRTSNSCLLSYARPSPAVHTFSENSALLSPFPPVNCGSLTLEERLNILLVESLSLFSLVKAPSDTQTGLTAITFSILQNLMSTCVQTILHLLQHLHPQPYCSDSTTPWIIACQAAALATYASLTCMQQTEIAANFHKEQDLYTVSWLLILSSPPKVTYMSMVTSPSEPPISSPTLIIDMSTTIFITSVHKLTYNVAPAEFQVHTTQRLTTQSLPHTSHCTSLLLSPHLASAQTPSMYIRSRTPASPSLKHFKIFNSTVANIQSIILDIVRVPLTGYVVNTLVVRGNR